MAGHKKNRTSGTSGTSAAARCSAFDSPYSSVNPLEFKFALNKDDFETLVGYFTPKDDILRIFRVGAAEMNTWCMDNYGLSFNETYMNLIAEARNYGRIAITRLAAKGHPTAMSIYSKYFAKFEEEQASKADTVPIIGFIPVVKKPDNVIEVVDDDKDK